MLFWCMAVCARGHIDILLEKSLCGVLSVEEQLLLCVCVCICVIVKERERGRKKVSEREKQEKRQKSKNTGLDLLRYWCYQRSAANAVFSGENKYNKAEAHLYLELNRTRSILTYLCIFQMYVCIYKCISNTNSFFYMSSLYLAGFLQTR